jgi:hypothetical protein
MYMKIRKSERTEDNFGGTEFYYSKYFHICLPTKITRDRLTINVPMHQKMAFCGFFVGPDRACKVRARVGLGLYTADSGFCGPGLVGGLEFWTVGLAQKPGPRGLGLLVSLVKA